MSSAIHLENIETYLFLLVDLIENSNSLNRNNRTVDAENLFCVLLNQAFGWKLTNANEGKINQDSFDLTDNEKCIYVQVTSNKNRTQKFNKTVEQFRKKGFKKRIHLIVLFISRKCPLKILKKQTEGKLTYEAYDIPTLFRNIYYKNKTADKLKPINELLETEIEPVRILSRQNDTISQGIKLSPPKKRKEDAGLYINRQTLIEDIFTFGQIANGLLVGAPGVGKSFIIEELHVLCTQKKIPCVIIRINDLLDASDGEIGEHIGIVNKDWISALNKSQFSSNEKAFLIFDAFDTAKDERIKSSIIKHIKKAISELEERWSILVSARTFDASKSARLLDLFPHININKSITCRYYEIPELSETELNATVKSDARLLAIFERCTSTLKNLTRVPYFLKLFEKIAIEKVKNENIDLLSIETEEQLLKVFWNKKVATSTDIDLFLRKLTNALAATENLTCKKDIILTDRNTNVYDHLISLEILTESSTTKQNLSFSHNILLEYAISIYQVYEDIEEQIDYLRNNPKMPFLFRQSFIYFYSKVWNLDPPLFWKHYFQTRSINEPLFRLFHQTVLNFVLGGFYTSIDQLDPIFSFPIPEEKANIIRKVLEGVRFVNKGLIREKDFDLLLESTNHASEYFVWELGFLIQKAIQQLTQEPNRPLLAKVTKASTNYLNFILTRRTVPSSKWQIDTNGSIWGVQNVCKTFSVNKTVGKKLLKQVLLILKEEDFSIRYFYTLSDNILDLFAHDPSFGAFVYKTIYAHNEVSEKETYLGSSAVMSLRSNRRQDFHSIHHKLENCFPQILRLSPHEAIKFGAEIVNIESIKKTRYPGKRLTFTISVGNINAKITPDYSFLGLETDKEHGPLSHLEKIFRYFDELVNAGKTKEVVELASKLISEAEATTVWKRLLRFFMVHPNLFKNEAFYLLVNEAIYVCDETVYEAGELLKTLWPSLLKQEKAKVENCIEGLLTSGLLNEDRESIIRKILRVLSCIPHSEVMSPLLHSILLKNGGTQKNEPMVRYSGVRPYNRSYEETLQDAGVNSDSESEMDAYVLIMSVKPFNDKYDHSNSSKPPKAEFEPLIPTVKKLYEVYKNQTSFNQRLSFNCGYEVCRFAKLLSRHQDKLNKRTRMLVEEIAFHYVNDKSFKENDYDKGKINSQLGAYSPTPRTAAAIVFVNLLYSDKSGEIAPIVESLISDNIQIVRFKVLHAVTVFWHKNRDLFWKVLNERAKLEGDAMCLHEVINSVCYDNIIQESQSQVEKIAILIGENLFQSGEDPVRELWGIYAVMLLKLLIKYNSSIAKDIIYNNIMHKSFVRNLVFEITTVLDPHEKENDYVCNRSKHDNLIQILFSVLEVRFEHIRNNFNNENLSDDFETIDSLIQQLYFSIVHGRRDNKGKNTSKKNIEAFYFKVKPILRYVVNQSSKIDSGFMVAHTGYYFMELLNHMLSADPEFILKISSDVVRCAAVSNFTYDSSTMAEIVKLTEQILADHKDILYKREHLDSLIAILDQFANSGWQEALELTWRLKEVF